jgi:hypothetical protein
MLPTEEFESYTYILERSDRSGETNVTAAGCRVLSAFDTSQKSLYHAGRYGLVEYEGHDPVGITTISVQYLRRPDQQAETYYTNRKICSFPRPEDNCLPSMAHMAHTLEKGQGSAVVTRKK